MEQVKRALGLVQMMRSEGLAPTEITYNILLRLCGLGGCWAMGLELMGMMEVICFGLSFPEKSGERPAVFLAWFCDITAHVVGVVVHFAPRGWRQALLFSTSSWPQQREVVWRVEIGDALAVLSSSLGELVVS